MYACEWGGAGVRCGYFEKERKKGGGGEGGRGGHCDLTIPYTKS